MEKYIIQAKELGMLHAELISPDHIYVDIRTVLRCKWGCDISSDGGNKKCDDRRALSDAVKDKTLRPVVWN